MGGWSPTLVISKGWSWITEIFRIVICIQIPPRPPLLGTQKCRDDCFTQLSWGVGGGMVRVVGIQEYREEGRRLEIQEGQGSPRRAEGAVGPGVRWIPRGESWLPFLLLPSSLPLLFFLPQCPDWDGSWQVVQY